MKTDYCAVVALLFGIGLGSASLSAQAYTYSWDARAAVPDNTSVPSGSTSSGSAAVTVSAYANTGSGGAIASANLYDYGAPYGVGVLSGSETANSYPNHAMDNSGYSESMLFSFTGPGASPLSVVLKQIGIGWAGLSNGYDSDITVLAYTGANPMQLAGKKYSDLLGLGWQLIGNYANIASNTSVTINTPIGNAAPISSSYWLVMAYNSVFNTGTGNGKATDANSSTTGLSSCSSSSTCDYAKLLSVYGDKPSTQTQVPEPSTLLLLGGALFGIVACRRRQVGPQLAV